MKLKYNILWFEDDKVSYNGKKELVKAIVEDELGFFFPEPRLEIDGTNIQTIDYDDFDLLIVDLNLAGTKGPALIDKIRHNENIYTEVIFYSSEGEKAVRDALKEYEIDGAYCADRGDDFEEKARRVIKTTVKKIQDLNNMRGLIMAETSDIDATMFQIIAATLEKNINGISVDVKKFIFDSVGKKVSGKKEAYDSCVRNDNINKVIKDNVMFDTSEKIKAVQFIINAIDHELTIPHRPDIFSTNYSTLKKTRDLLAHVIEDIKDGKKVLRSGNNELEFTDEFCFKLRTDVKKHGADLSGILELILA
jgi:CheY-like chemotaxis protein